MSALKSKMPEDYAIDALAVEAERRGKVLNRPDYSYGKLVADTTAQQREKIADEYRSRKLKEKRKS